MSGARAPVAINKYLLPRERHVAVMRMHIAILLAPSAEALGGLLVAGILSATVVHGVAAAIMWVLWLLLFLRLVWKTLNWAVDYFVVTSERVLLTTGVLTRRVNMMPMTKVTDMRFQRSFGGRLLGYGEFIFESAGQDQALSNVDFLPYPEQLYILICEILFPSSAADPEDGETRPVPVPDEL